MLSVNLFQVNCSLTHILYRLVAGGAVSRVNPNSTGLNPAWRKALAHVIFAAVWADGTTTTTEIDQLRKKLARQLTIISDITPGSGAYFNEVSVPVLLPVNSRHIHPPSRHPSLNRMPATRSLGHIITS
jgi:hypothetical protein